MAVCWFCGADLHWESDFNYDEFWGEGEGIVAILHCSNCGAEAIFSRKEEENE